jgi:hypothetical protein
MNEVRFPHFSHLALQLLYIPAMSAPSQWVFSNAGLTIAKDCATLLLKWQVYFYIMPFQNLINMIPVYGLEYTAFRPALFYLANTCTLRCILLEVWLFNLLIQTSIFYFFLIYKNFKYDFEHQCNYSIIIATILIFHIFVLPCHYSQSTNQFYFLIFFIYKNFKY